MARFDPEAREREARAEIEATRIPTTVAAAIAALFLLVLATGPVLELGAAARGSSRVLRPLASEPGTLASARAAIAELEARFDERSELVHRVRPTFQALLSRALGYGNEQAYIGRDGWLFFRPGFDHLTARPASPGAARDAARIAIGFRDQLARRGVGLVLVPAPVKLAIHPGRFVRGAPRAPLRPRAELEFLAELAAAGVEVVDPAQRIARRAGTSDAYLERDTHWRPEVVDEVARDLAVRLRGLADLPPGQPELWIESELAIEGEGDLAQILGLPDRFEAPRQRVELQRVSALGGTSWRPRKGAPVLLLGDSFAGVYSQPDLGWGAGAGLAERLAFHLGLPVDRIVRNAGGASATRSALADELATDPKRLAGVRIVVWELAAREISQGRWESAPLPAAPPG